MADKTCMQRIEIRLIPIIRMYSEGSINDCIWAMHERLVEKEEKKLSLEEVSTALRKVVQVEGVMLHEKQKGFFRELFGNFMRCVSDAGLMRK